MAELAVAPESPSTPRWIAPSLEVKPGRDPLGLQTTTQDRLMPVLLPGILELSRRARYLSFHAFLLDEYARKRLPADSLSLSIFIKRREWDYGLAVLSCPHNCGSVPVGADSLRPAMRQSGPPFPRGESVQSAFGGYGLYYRSPLAELGIVARAGTPLGDQPIPIDVLTTSERATQLAAAFRAAVEETEYLKRWMYNDQPLPIEVLRQYADVGCLCQLPFRDEERDAVHEALFGTDPAPVQEQVQAIEGVAIAQILPENAPAVADPLPLVVQRRRSVAHYLTLLDRAPAIIEDESVYRESLWSPPPPRSEGHALVAGHWAALIAKDVWQDSLCSIWSEFYRAGLARTRELGRGLTWAETAELSRNLVGGPPVLDRELRTRQFADDLAAGRASLDGGLLPVSATLEELRAWTEATDSATSGLITLLELQRRVAQRTGEGWRGAANISSAWQPALASVLDALTTHMGSNPSVSETIWWIVRLFVIHPHERIAYSKMPEFTFRFRWEEGLLRFYDYGLWRFPLASIRMAPLASLAGDIALWARDGEGHAALTPRGRSFISEVLG